MPVFLSHLDSAPILYGVIIILGMATIWWKFARGNYTAALIEIAIFMVVFKLHSGTMTGGMAATVAALLGGFLFPIVTRVARFRRRRSY